MNPHKPFRSALLEAHWRDTDNLILDVRVSVRAQQEQFAQQTAQRGITVEQLTAAAITTAVQNRMEEQR